MSYVKAVSGDFLRELEIQMMLVNNRKMRPVVQKVAALSLRSAVLDQVAAVLVQESLVSFRQKMSLKVVMIGSLVR
jgi:hypothetical protein